MCCRPVKNVLRQFRIVYNPGQCLVKDWFPVFLSHPDTESWTTQNHSLMRNAYMNCEGWFRIPILLGVRKSRVDRGKQICIQQNESCGHTICSLTSNEYLTLIRMQHAIDIHFRTTMDWFDFVTWQLPNQAVVEGVLKGWWPQRKQRAGCWRFAWRMKGKSVSISIFVSFKSHFFRIWKMIWQSSSLHGCMMIIMVLNWKSKASKWNKRSQPDDGRVFFLRRTPPGIAIPHPCANLPKSPNKISRLNHLFKVVFYSNFLPLKKKVNPIPTIHWRNLCEFSAPPSHLGLPSFQGIILGLGHTAPQQCEDLHLCFTWKATFHGLKQKQIRIVNGYWSNSILHIISIFASTVTHVNFEPCNMSWLLVHYATSLLMYFADTFHELHQCFLLFLSPPWSLFFFCLL